MAAGLLTEEDLELMLLFDFAPYDLLLPDLEPDKLPSTYDPLKPKFSFHLITVNIRNLGWEHDCFVPIIHESVNAFHFVDIHFSLF